MSKPVKEMIVDEYRRRFDGVSGAVVIELRGIDAVVNNQLRTDLHKKDVQVTVVKNTLARKAFAGGPLEVLGESLDGPSAIVYGAESVVDVARELVTFAKKIDKLELKAAVLDGEFFAGDAGVKALSKFPTREEALAKVVALVLSPFQNVVGAAGAPGGNILGVVKTIQEKLEKGETIEAVG